MSRSSSGTQRLEGEARRLRLAFIYPPFYPVTGGQSVHGYHLARELHALGYDICTWGRQNDGFTRGVARNPMGLLRMLLSADLVYFRMGVERRKLHRVPLLARVFGKKALVELNAPADELVAKGYAVRSLADEDARLAGQMRPANAVVVVSSTLRRYCKEFLGLTAPIEVIPNGADRIAPELCRVPAALRSAAEEFCRAHRRVVIWSGTREPWQGLEIVERVVAAAHPSIGFFLIAASPDMLRECRTRPNVRVFDGLSHEQASFLTSVAHVGLAVYGSYDWCRIGFYGSSLKFCEYLANGLYVVTTFERDTGLRTPQVWCSKDPAEIVRFIETVDISKCRMFAAARSWRDVAQETDRVLKRTLGGW